MYYIFKIMKKIADYYRSHLKIIQKFSDSL